MSNIAGHGLINLLKEKEDLIGAEIGCDQGFTTEFLLKHLKFNRLFCVDPWEPYEGENTGAVFTTKQNAMYHHVEFMKRVMPYMDKIAILQMTSKDAADVVDDNWLDFVFIDANHAYNAVMEDLNLWWPKVKAGGIFSGHDWSYFDVKPAVREFFKNDLNKIQLVYNDMWYVVK